MFGKRSPRRNNPLIVCTEFRRVVQLFQVSRLGTSQVSNGLICHLGGSNMPRFGVEFLENSNTLLLGKADGAKCSYFFHIPGIERLSDKTSTQQNPPR